MEKNSPTEKFDFSKHFLNALLGSLYYIFVYILIHNDSLTKSNPPNILFRQQYASFICKLFINIPNFHQQFQLLLCTPGN